MAALATDSGVTAHSYGKTAWFILTAAPDLTLDPRQADHEAEATAVLYYAGLRPEEAVMLGEDNLTLPALTLNEDTRKWEEPHH